MVAVRDHRNDCSDAVFDMNTTYSFCVRSRITVIFVHVVRFKVLQRVCTACAAAEKLCADHHRSSPEHTPLRNAWTPFRVDAAVAS